jgi:hypothetical protein
MRSSSISYGLFWYGQFGETKVGVCNHGNDDAGLICWNIYHFSTISSMIFIRRGVLGAALRRVAGLCAEFESRVLFGMVLLVGAYRQLARRGRFSYFGVISRGY